MNVVLENLIALNVWVCAKIGLFTYQSLHVYVYVPVPPCNVLVLVPYMFMYQVLLVVVLY